MEFSRQEYQSGLPFPSPGDLLGPGIELRSPALQANSLPSEPPGNSLLHYLVLCVLMILELKQVFITKIIIFICNLILFLKFYFLIEVQLMYNVVLDSGVQYSDSVLSILFQILFPYRLL
ncbi:unnamed protein product [Rangifer tarandus platyrhynchus]|uniref:Uncharacterized protein n=1 Tax=Rangifer tarandus platyrhynchus TaxID=3082113 RepID=A0AC59YG19_RANTA